MTTANIILRWAGAADATSASTYKIERTLDNSAWSTLAAAQAATSPYVSPSSTLSGNHTYGATSVVLASGTAFSSSGYGWIDDAMIQWTGKSTDTLTGVTWHSGYGTYATGSAVYEAHEDYTDNSVTMTLNAALYRITHIDSGGVEAAPLYLWYYDAPVPASSQHCVVIVNIGADLGVSAQAGATVSAYLVTDNQFAEIAGQHLDSNAISDNTTTSNAFGLAFFHCWKNSYRVGIGGASDAAYTFILKPGVGQLALTAATIPDRDWVLLSQIAAS